jgi:thiol-disulfide isomerase/thioredoxin
MSYIDSENKSYKNKYLKYKTKYLELKKLKGGNNNNNNNKITITLFKADWCGHCQAFKRTWENMNKKYNNKYNFIIMDSEKNKKEIKENNIKGFPTIVISNNETKVEYTERDRTEEKIINFIKNNFN